MAALQQLRKVFNLDTFLLAALVVTTALAAATVGYSADNLAMIIDHLWFSVYVRVYPFNSEDSGWLRYQPENFDLSPLQGVLAAGILGVAGSVIVMMVWAVRMWSSTKTTAAAAAGDNKGVKKSAPIALALSLITLLTTLALTIYARNLFPVASGRGAVELELYFMDPDRMGLDGIWSIYSSPRVYNPVQWNCALASQVTPGDRGESIKRTTLDKMCVEGIRAYALCIAMVAAQGFVVGILAAKVWMERRARKAAEWAAAA